MSTYRKYYEANRRYVETHREERNAKRRAKRLAARLTLLEGKKCLNCEILLVARLGIDNGRSYLYCRKCITEYSTEARRHRIRRYYYRKKGIKEPTSTENAPGYVVSWRTLKSR